MRINELSYPGNIGMMEVAAFYAKASPEQKNQFERLVAMGNNKEAWQLIQAVTNTKLVGNEFTNR